MATRSVKYMSPSVDFDTMPMWMADSKHLIFVRRPGLPFGQQTQQGAGGIGLPAGTGRGGSGGGRGSAATAAARRRQWHAGNGGGGELKARTGRRRRRPAVNNSPGLMRATFKGGYTLSFYKADVDHGRCAGDLAQPAERYASPPTSGQCAPGRRLRDLPVRGRWTRRRGGRGGAGAARTAAAAG